MEKYAEMSLNDFSAALASKEAVPGGGGASAAVGAFAAALGMMVANLTVGKKTYAAVEEEILGVRERLEKIRDQLVVLADRDAEAFEPLSKAYGMPKETEEQKAEKERVMENALYEASVVPLQIMETVKTAMDELELLEEKGSRIAVSDTGVGILFAQAALEGASLNIFINTRMMKDRMKAEDLNRRAEELIKEGTSQKNRIYENVLKKIR